MGKNISKEEALKLVDESISSGNAYNKFLELVKYQGGNINKIKVSPKTKRIRAYKSGKITDINALEIGELALMLGAGVETLDDKIDYSVGIELKHIVGDRVKKGDLLATLYVNSNVKIKNIKEIFKIS